MSLIKISASQIKTLQTACRLVETSSNGVFGEDAFRLALHNVGSVEPDDTGRVSCKALDQDGFEEVMALLEEMGFRDRGKPDDYWRSCLSGFATRRQRYKINALASDCRYPVETFCLQHSHNRTKAPEKLSRNEARKVIEAMKSAVDREGT